MPKVPVKQIRAKANKISIAWTEGAPTVTEFKDVLKTQFDADIADGEAADDLVEDLRAQLQMAEDARDAKYAKIGDNCVSIAEGVRGHKDYGADSPLYGAMGFVRTSERKSGLTHKSKDGNNEGDNNT